MILLVLTHHLRFICTKDFGLPLQELPYVFSYWSTTETCGLNSNPLDNLNFFSFFFYSLFLKVNKQNKIIIKKKKPLRKCDSFWQFHSGNKVSNQWTDDGWMRHACSSATVPQFFFFLIYLHIASRTFKVIVHKKLKLKYL